ncbi:DUF2341 domain-containing protein [bacterium]|nr:DUF2341 domain-containing protein [bacterium]
MKNHSYKSISYSALNLILLIFTILFLQTINASTAIAWWDGAWNYRKRISFNIPESEETFDNAVILLRLHSGNFDFSRIKEDGSDFRFVNSDDKIILPYHIEKFDFLDEMALIWVKVTGISSTENIHAIWMYYGNQSAKSVENVIETYDENMVAVYHFGESQGMPKDQTGYANHISEFSGGLGLPALIGGGVFLNGVHDRMIIPASPTLDFSEGFTFSTWIRIAMPQKDSFIMAMKEDKKTMVIGITGTGIYFELSTGDGQLTVAETNTSLQINTWHHLAISVNQTNRLRIYLDGTEKYVKNLSLFLPKISGNIYVGGAWDNGHFFSGDLDELQISNRSRPNAWISTAAENQGVDDQIIACGAEEFNNTGGAITRILYQYYQYLRTIIRNTTVDGALIIGILLIMLTVSQIVLVSKFLVFWLIQRDNKNFLKSFQNNFNLLSWDDKKQDFQNSPIYRIYKEGSQELKRRVGNADGTSDKKGLSPKAINSFKAILEKASTHEEQKLNSWLLILTFAISGAPFLGLLGTVWGVMNTFAAMAAAGEADIVVIAPGIASALSTTVVGLIVAIPALFAYNILVDKIKNIMADIYLFVDDIVCKTDEIYGEGS